MDFIEKYNKIILIYIECLPFAVLLAVAIFLALSYRQKIITSSVYKFDKKVVTLMFKEQMLKYWAEIKKYFINMHKEHWDFVYVGIPLYLIILITILAIGLVQNFYCVLIQWFKNGVYFINNDYYFDEFMNYPNVALLYYGYMLMMSYSSYMALCNFRKKNIFNSV